MGTALDVLLKAYEELGGMELILIYPIECSVMVE